MQALLSVRQTKEAELRAIASGIPGIELMERAGAEVAKVVMYRYPAVPVLVLCGSGNNGGDGFVVARLLAEAGWQVRVALLGERAALTGDAAQAAAKYAGSVEPLAAQTVQDGMLIIDALFGTGLSRPIDGVAAEVVAAVNTKKLPVVAVDVPSGVQGDSGQVQGVAMSAEITVTFISKKPGHLLLPGSHFCGDVRVADIGVGGQGDSWENTPDVWLPSFPWKREEQHKYHHGHVLVAGGDKAHTGAGRLAATSALRIGAGLVTIACNSDALPLYAASPMAAMTAPVNDVKEFASALVDARINACLIGPGAGVGEETRGKVFAALLAGKRTVLDADALTSFMKAPQQLFESIQSPCIITPHEGEFERLFSMVDAHAGKIARARKAARVSNSVVILKGADTVIAAPDGRVVVNRHASPALATAGSGDVLAGLCAGLLAQGMDAWLAAAAAVWIHGDAALRFGAGLIADDLPIMLPLVLRDLQETME